MKVLMRILDAQEEKERRKICEIKEIRKREKWPLLIRNILFWPQLIFKMIFLTFIFISSYLIIDYIKTGTGNLALIILLLIFAAVGEIAWKGIQERDEELLEKAKVKYGEEFDKPLK